MQAQTQRLFQKTIKNVKKDSDEVEINEYCQEIDEIDEAGQMAFEGYLMPWPHAKIYQQLLQWIIILCGKLDLCTRIFGNHPVVEITRLGKKTVAKFFPRHTGRGENCGIIKINSLHVDKPFWIILIAVVQELVRCDMWKESVVKQEEKTPTRGKTFRRKMELIGILVNGKGNFIAFTGDKFKNLLDANGIEYQESYAPETKEEPKKARVNWKQKVAELEAKLAELEAKVAAPAPAMQENIIDDDPILMDDKDLIKKIQDQIALEAELKEKGTEELEYVKIVKIDEEIPEEILDKVRSVIVSTVYAKKTNKVSKRRMIEIINGSNEINELKKKYRYIHSRNLRCDKLFSAAIKSVEGVKLEKESLVLI